LECSPTNSGPRVPKLARKNRTARLTAFNAETTV
jgi:hypothetical protein